MITCGVDFHNISQIKTVRWTVKNYNNVTCEAGELKRGTGGSDLAN